MSKCSSLSLSLSPETSRIAGRGSPGGGSGLAVLSEGFSAGCAGGSCFFEAWGFGFSDCWANDGVQIREKKISSMETDIPQIRFILILVNDLVMPPETINSAECVKLYTRRAAIALRIAGDIFCLSDDRSQRDPPTPRLRLRRSGLKSENWTHSSRSADCGSRPAALRAGSHEAI